MYLPPSYGQSSQRGAFRWRCCCPATPATAAAAQPPAWQMPLTPRLDDSMRSGRAAEAIVILPDCFTRYGGSQYVDSPAIGRYQSYLADELVPFVDEKYRTIPRREARAVIGKSSGGYGAMVMGMLRARTCSARSARTRATARSSSRTSGVRRTRC